MAAGRCVRDSDCHGNRILVVFTELYEHTHASQGEISDRSIVKHLLNLLHRHSVDLHQVCCTRPRRDIYAETMRLFSSIKFRTSANTHRSALMTVAPRFDCITCFMLQSTRRYVLVRLDEKTRSQIMSSATSIKYVCQSGTSSMSGTHPSSRCIFKQWTEVTW